MIALAVTSPLVLTSGEVFGPEMLVLYLVAFPSGLFELLPPRALVAVAEARTQLGWTSYVVMSIALLACGCDLVWRRLFALLCVLLTVNVVGCYSPLLR